jgi:type I restriction enzyme S subunit
VIDHRIFWPGAPHREQVPFRRLFRPLSRPVPEGASIVTAYTDGEVTLRSNRSKIGYHEAADLSGFQGVKRGDFVVHGLDIMRGSVGISDSDGAISAVCTVCEPSPSVDPRFIAYAIRLQATSGYPKALARGVREGGADFRRWATLAELPIPVAPLAEQRAIADYLDRETAQIDTLIAKQERLILLLRERRWTLVEHALSQAAPVLPLRRLAECLDSVRKPLNAEERALRPGTVPYWGANTIQGFVDQALLDEELVLVGEDGAPFFDRNRPVAFRSIGPIWPNNHIHVLRPYSNVEASWLAHALNTTDYSLHVAGSTRDKLTQAALMRIEIPLPPLDEQRRIVVYLDEQTAKIDTLIAKAELFIELAKERRAALITAAVTGQLDVTAA